MKKVVIAIDSFKGCLTSKEAGRAVEAGVKAIFPNCETLCFPLADGGEGVLGVLVAATNGRTVSVVAHDALMQPVDACYGLSGDGKTALIEMAIVNGLPQVPLDKRNPMLTTTYGTGELIKNALDRGCRDFVVGIGGSATNDAGLGMLQALGFRFLDKEGQVLGVGGKIMAQVAQVDYSMVHPALKESHFTVACDVQSPFYGTHGAAYVYAPQKGADDDMVRDLDVGMQSLAEVILQTTGKDIAFYPGAGAAGGLGGGFLAFLNAELKTGVRLILDALDFQTKIAGADLIITGEGRVDRQTTMGKVPFGVLQAAQKQNIPVVVVAGSIDYIHEMNTAGFQGVFSVVPGPMSLEKAMEPAFASANIKRVVSQLCCVIRSFRCELNR